MQTEASASTIDYCALAQKFGKVMVDYTTYTGGDGSTKSSDTNAASKTGNTAIGILLFLTVYLFA